MYHMRYTRIITGTQKNRLSILYLFHDTLNALRDTDGKT